MPEILEAKDGGVVEKSLVMRLIILDYYDTEAEMRAAHPTGADSDCYKVGDDLYLWGPAINDWKNIGPLRGKPGDILDLDAETAERIQLAISASETATAARNEAVEAQIAAEAAKNIAEKSADILSASIPCGFTRLFIDTTTGHMIARFYGALPEESITINHTTGHMEFTTAE